MSVAGQMVVGDRRPFTVQILASPAYPDLTSVQTVYLYVLRGTGTKEQWAATIASRTANQILATYAPVQGNNDTPGETIHIRPYLHPLQIAPPAPPIPDVPCAGFEIQVVAA